jgi:hypothetical protein
MNYKKLIEDSRKGYIDWDYVTLVMDNDGGYWYCDDGDEDRKERMEDNMKLKYGEPNGYRDLVDILVAAGINADWC